jgi:hypothetical protein
MMKYTSILTLLPGYFAFGQNNEGTSNSKIYIRATYFDKKTNISQTRTDLADIIIDNIKYRKFQIDLTDYSENKKQNILRNFYE